VIAQCLPGARARASPMNYGDFGSTLVHDGSIIIRRVSIRDAASRRWILVTPLIVSDAPTRARADMMPIRVSRSL